LKILIPNYYTPDSFEENVSATLSKMGHEVANMGELSIYKKSSTSQRLIKEVRTKILGSFSDQEKWLLEKIKTFNPALVICLTQALSEEVLHEVHKKGIKVVSWWGDTAANMSGKGLCHKEWDMIFIKDHYAAFKLRTINLPAIQLYEAMNPMWHKPISQQQNNKVVIAGSFYDYRHYITTQLIDHKVEVGLYGAKVPRWASREIKERHSGKFITKEEKSKVFGSAMAVLNSTGMSEFSSVNCRAFEIAGIGGLQVMEYRKSIEECFEPGKEILLFNNLDELFEILERAARYPEEMKIIRDGAAKRAAGEHTYEHRLQVILKHYQNL
jgi:spore maturation protein CgeB